MIQYEDELLHHGVKGMKWGVRRYQNYDGSYTQAGVKRYHAAKSLYDEADKKYKVAKTNYKNAKKAYAKDSYTAKNTRDYNTILGKHTAKVAMKSAKRERKHEKKELSKAYDHLKQDKRADKGKQLYKDGKTITAGRELTNKMIGTGATLSALGIGMKKAYIFDDPISKKGVGHNRMVFKDNKDYLQYKLRKQSPADIAIKAGTALAIIAAGKKIYDHNKNKKLRAYYAHSSYKRGKTNKRYDQTKKYNRNEALSIVTGK